MSRDRHDMNNEQFASSAIFFIHSLIITEICCEMVKITIFNNKKKGKKPETSGQTQCLK